MSENLEHTQLIMRMKPIQMALMNLGFEHDMVMTDNGMELVVRQPPLTTTFRLDPMTGGIETEYVWHVYLDAKKKGENLELINQVNGLGRDLQFVLEDVDRSRCVVRGREFFFATFKATWEQVAEYVHYCMTGVASEFLYLCEGIWPEHAPARGELQQPVERPEPVRFAAEYLAEGNPFGLIEGDTPAVTMERIYHCFEQAGVGDLAAGDGFVEFYVSGQRVSAQLSDGRDGRDRQTLQVSSGLAVKVRKNKQLKKLLELCNKYSSLHTFVTVFVESLADGSVAVYAESRIDIPAGMNDEQLDNFLLGATKWTTQISATVAAKAM